MELKDLKDKEMCTVEKFVKRNEERGTWPGTAAAVWGLRADAPQNGFGKAFVKVGRRVLVDVEEFWKAVYYLQEVKNGSHR
jgi:hypothetical protein